MKYVTWYVPMRNVLLGNQIFTRLALEVDDGVRSCSIPVLVRKNRLAYVCRLFGYLCLRRFVVLDDCSYMKEDIAKCRIGGVGSIAKGDNFYYLEDIDRMVRDIRM